MEHARAATAADIEALRHFWDMAVEELDGQRGGKLLAGTLDGPGSRDDLLTGMLRDGDRLLVIGSTDGVDVGFASVRCDRERREPVGVVEAVYVEPSARQVGVGEAMIEFAMGWCVERGCIGVDAPALPGSRSAKAFFEDHGFVARLLVMHHPLPSGAEPSGG